MSFTVWQSKDTIYIIDGHHRYKVLDLLEKEGVNVPKKLPCTFIDCKDKKEASKLVLTYSSIYAKVQEEGLYEFLNVNNFDFESLRAEIDIPNIDLEKFELGYFKEQDEEKLNDVPALQEKSISKLGDLFLIDGKHRVLCGDSTKEESYKVLFGGKKADLFFQSPPYNVGHNLGYGTKSKYKNSNDNLKDWKELILNSTKLAINHGKDVFINLQILANNKRDLIKFWYELVDNFKDVFYWKKLQAAPATAYNVVNSQTEIIILFGDNVSRSWGNKKFHGNVSNYIETKSNSGENKNANIHNAGFPVQLPLYFINNGYNQNSIIADAFLGTGTTLIASEQTNSNCYGIELDPLYIDVILRRYKKLYPDAKFECLNRKFDFKELFKEVS